jgi:hypothetical protein
VQCDLSGNRIASDDKRSVGARRGAAVARLNKSRLRATAAAGSGAAEALREAETRPQNRIDRQGLRDDDTSRSWNSAHPSHGPDGGCSQADLRGTDGDGLFYCFAV